MKWQQENISAFKSLNAAPKTVTLGKWLEICTSRSAYTAKVEQYRNSKNPNLKKSLPLATPGAVLYGGRRKEDVIKRTGWIAIDIDGKDNPHIHDWQELRDSLGKIVYVAFAALSVSAGGAWALIKISQPDRQADHFLQLIEDFKSVNINLDTSKGRNPNDARFLTYDPDAYIAQDFVVYDRLPVKHVTFRKKNKRHKFKKQRTSGPGGSTKQRVEECLGLIENQCINLAPHYEDYLRIGFAFAEEFGEAGRDFFHRAVCYSDKYNRREADRQFSHCLDYNHHNISIGTFFHYCNQNNL